MPMDLIEHEVANLSVGGITGRGHTDIHTIGTGAAKLNKTFLIKKMEIEFSFFPPAVSNDAGVLASQPAYLILQDESSGTDADTTAESFDAALENKAVHETVIWSRNFPVQYGVIDDADNIVWLPAMVNFKTSKSFPKGFPLSKEKTYQWKMFNAGAVLLTGGFLSLRVRYWGVYLKA